MSAPHPGTLDASGDDLSLIRRVAAGEAEALRWLYDRHAARALALCLRVVRIRGDAEEVVQETFVEVWRRAGDYDPGRGTPLAWLTTICRTRAIDRLRTRGAQDRVAALLAAPVADLAPTPSDHAEAVQLRHRVQAALATLPDEQRRVLELAYFEGLSQSEIAERTGDALGTVKTRVRLGMEKLAAVLFELWGGQRS